MNQIIIEGDNLIDIKLKAKDLDEAIEKLIDSKKEIMIGKKGIQQYQGILRAC